MTSLQFPAKGLLRRGVTAIALFAVLLLLAQPVCRASDAVHVDPGKPAAPLLNEPGYAGNAGHDPDAGPCCAEIEAGALLALSPADVSGAIVAAQAVAPAARVAPPQDTPARHPRAAWNTAPPLSLSYHVRSARILR